MNDAVIAASEDIPKWMELVDIVKDDFPGLEYESYLATLKKNILRETALCYKENGNIFGILLFSPDRCCLSCMAVHPDHRHMGIASILIEKMICLMPKGRDITVTTFREGDEKGIAARKLYKKSGFKEGSLIYEFDYPVQKFVLHRDDPDENMKDI
ncbi:MAG: GNAT family N-acetyltransferase [Clostridia bacterium]